MTRSMPTGASTPTAAAPMPKPMPQRKGRLMIDAPTRAFHWLFALSFAGAWLTAESERWRGVHVTLGYLFGALLLYRLLDGLLGPRQVRLALMGRRVAGLGDWFRSAAQGNFDLPRLTALGVGLSVLLLLVVAAPLVLSGYAAQVEWLGLEDAMEELHEFFANAAMALVLAHLVLLVLLSVLRRKNLAMPMVTGRTEGPGPDLAKSNRSWLAVLVVLASVGFLGWQAYVDLPAWNSAQPATASQRENDD